MLFLCKYFLHDIKNLTQLRVDLTEGSIWHIKESIWQKGRFDTIKGRFDRRVVSTKGPISFQGRFDLSESHSAMESQNEAHRGQCVDQKRPLYVGPKQTRTWESFWSVGPYWQLMGLNWKMMGPLRQRVGPIWISSIPKMARIGPKQLWTQKGWNGICPF